MADRTERDSYTKQLQDWTNNLFVTRGKPVPEDGSDVKPSFWQYVPWWVWSIVLLVPVLVGAWKVLEAPPFDLTLDVPTLIALVLALFSMYLSAKFYFNATETSNKFYASSQESGERTATSLERIENRFGEQLAGLKESAHQTQALITGLTETEATLAQKRDAVVKVMAAPELTPDERNKHLAEYEETVKQLEAARDEIEVLRKGREADELRSVGPLARWIRLGAFFHGNVIPLWGGAAIVASWPLPFIAEMCQNTWSAFPNVVRLDLRGLGLLSGRGKLTPPGQFWIHNFAVNQAADEAEAEGTGAGIEAGLASDQPSKADSVGGIEAGMAPDPKPDKSKP